MNPSQNHTVEGDYPKGGKLVKKSMKPYEACLCHLDELGKRFIRTPASSAAAMVAANAV